MLKSKIRYYIFKCFRLLIPDLYLLEEFKERINGKLINADVESPVKLYSPYRIVDSKIGKYTYISEQAFISGASIGRFCSIGPRLLCGWGIHPIDGISTSPMFYSTKKQNGYSLSTTDKVKERKEITIGNDVFIGANVTILDGINIGDGAVIGAGCVVSKDVPAYAIAAGVPMQILKYRFEKEQIEALLRIQWWNWPDDKLQEIENNFFNINEFLQKTNKSNS